ncbi:hypothetical protein ACEPAI_5570 [Sanghuangporus weigelae]
MLASTLFVFLSFFGALVVAQNTPSVVCIAGQCVQGFTNLTLGTTLSASGSTANLHLLPGQYTESTNPQLLHSLLTSSSATISSSAGFPNGSSVSLPLSIQLQPGFAFYSSANYSGAANYVPLPTSANASNVTTPFDGGSFVLSSDTWAELSSSNGRVILWDASPDVSQLPGSFAGLSLAQLQSSSCSSACATGATMDHAKSVSWVAQPAPTPLELARPVRVGLRCPQQTRQNAIHLQRLRAPARSAQMDHSPMALPVRRAIVFARLVADQPQMIVLFAGLVDINSMELAYPSTVLEFVRRD